MKETIRDICLRSGFTIKEGETDLKPYVFEAGEKLIRAGQAMAAIARANSPYTDQRRQVVAQERVCP